MQCPDITVTVGNPMERHGVLTWSRLDTTDRDMRIEELILEGFKSYPVRTQITGWDSSFNAITGLNGSGKSNILDAICFVLGLTNMSSVRRSNTAHSVYDLIFSFRCGRRINRISFTSVDRLASQRPLSLSSLTIQTDKTAPLEWRIMHR
jgi:predicted ATP-dependent endonuclease of OLD family